MPLGAPVLKNEPDPSSAYNGPAWDPDPICVISDLSLPCALVAGVGQSSSLRGPAMGLCPPAGKQWDTGTGTCPSLGSRALLALTECGLWVAHASGQ